MLLNNSGKSTKSRKRHQNRKSHRQARRQSLENLEARQMMAGDAWQPIVMQEQADWSSTPQGAEVAQLVAMNQTILNGQLSGVDTDFVQLELAEGQLLVAEDARGLASITLRDANHDAIVPTAASNAGLLHRIEKTDTYILEISRNDANIANANYSVVVQPVGLNHESLDLQERIALRDHQGSMYAWLGSDRFDVSALQAVPLSQSQRDALGSFRPLTISGPTGHGFRIFGDWEIDTSGVETSYAADGIVFLENDIGVPLPMVTGSEAFTVTTSQQDWSEHFGQVDSIANFPDLGAAQLWEGVTGFLSNIGSDLQDSLGIELPSLDFDFVDINGPYLDYGIGLGKETILEKTEAPVNSASPYLYFTFNLNPSLTAHDGRIEGELELLPKFSIVFDPSDWSIYAGGHGGLLADLEFSVSWSDEGLIPLRLSDVERPEAWESELFGNFYTSWGNFTATADLDANDDGQMFVKRAGEHTVPDVSLGITGELEPDVLSRLTSVFGKKRRNDDRSSEGDNFVGPLSDSTQSTTTDSQGSRPTDQADGDAGTESSAPDDAAISDASQTPANEEASTGPELTADRRDREGAGQTMSDRDAFVRVAGQDIQQLLADGVISPLGGEGAKAASNKVGYRINGSRWVLLVSREGSEQQLHGEVEKLQELRNEGVPVPDVYEDRVVFLGTDENAPIAFMEQFVPGFEMQHTFNGPSQFGRDIAQALQQDEAGIRVAIADLRVVRSFLVTPEGNVPNRIPDLQLRFNEETGRPLVIDPGMDGTENSEDYGRIHLGKLDDVISALENALNQSVESRESAEEAAGNVGQDDVLAMFDNLDTGTGDFQSEFGASDQSEDSSSGGSSDNPDADWSDSDSSSDNSNAEWSVSDSPSDDSAASWVDVDETVSLAPPSDEGTSDSTESSESLPAFDHQLIDEAVDSQLLEEATSLDPPRDDETSAEAISLDAPSDHGMSDSDAPISLDSSSESELERYGHDSEHNDSDVESGDSESLPGFGESDSESLPAFGDQDDASSYSSSDGVAVVPIVVLIPDGQRGDVDSNLGETSTGTSVSTERDASTAESNPSSETAHTPDDANDTSATNENAAVSDVALRDQLFSQLTWPSNNISPENTETEVTEVETDDAERRELQDTGETLQLNGMWQMGHGVLIYDANEYSLFYHARAHEPFAGTFLDPLIPLDVEFVLDGHHDIKEGTGAVDVSGYLNIVGLEVEAELNVAYGDSWIPTVNVRGMMNLPLDLGGIEVSGYLGSDGSFELKGNGELNLAGFAGANGRFLVNNNGIEVETSIDVLGSAVDVRGLLHADGQFLFSGDANLNILGHNVVGAHLQLSNSGLEIDAMIEVLDSYVRFAGSISSNGQFSLEGSSNVQFPGFSSETEFRFDNSGMHLATGATVLGSQIAVSGDLQANGSYSLTGSGNIEIAGMDTRASVTLGNSGLRFTAVSQNDGAFADQVSRDLSNWSSAATAGLQQAQSGLNAAQAEVNKLNSALATARAKAQQDFNAVRSDLTAAENAVKNAQSSVNSWAKTVSSRKSSWQSAVRATKNSSWWNYAYYKGIEAGRYASYKAAQVAHGTAIAGLKVAEVALAGVRAAAGWALNAVGVDAHPEVIALRVALTAANVSLDAAQAVVWGVEQASSSALNAAAYAARHSDSIFEMNQVRFSGLLSAASHSQIDLDIDYRWLGQASSIDLRMDTRYLSPQHLSDAVTDSIMRLA